MSDGAKFDPQMATGRGLGGRSFNQSDLIPVQPRRTTTRENLEHRKAAALASIQQIDRALRLLDSNPDTEELLNLLGEIGAY